MNVGLGLGASELGPSLTGSAAVDDGECSLSRIFSLLLILILFIDLMTGECLG